MESNPKKSNTVIVSNYRVYHQDNPPDDIDNPICLFAFSSLNDENASEVLKNHIEKSNIETEEDKNKYILAKIIDWNK